MSSETMRAEFERWYSDDWDNPKAVGRGSDGHYLLAGAHSAWDAWQAAYAAGRRDAVPEWPLASASDADKGWTLDPAFILSITDRARNIEGDVSMEQTEAVLLAAAQQEKSDG